MNNVKVKEYKINSLKGELTFRMDFNALERLEEQYGSAEAMELFNDMIKKDNKKFYTEALKILCCCCKPATDYEELKAVLSLDMPTLLLLDDICCKLIIGFYGAEDKEEKQDQDQDAKKKGPRMHKIT